ncbi:MFS transporter [Variovorax sp. Sphag1AA]|uniref:MFS transporter n=1 Tax=Variovorax sp. Sphag1AA TaxID=2587027 RepID=UPI001619146F|nr:MFS transporter [Variovorax sp. Sphag1AA]MBB3178765.1 MFS family permease [Variovorax sp. Sphag1AA]
MILTRRWCIAGFLFVAGALNYMDRMAISIASPAIMADLHVSAEQMGFVFSSFFAGYALLNLIGGLAADRYGPNLVLALSLTAWSVLCGLTALAQGFWSLISLRVAFGASEGPLGATAAKIINAWFPKRELSRALAVATSGTPFGALAAGPLVGVLISYCGWRVSLTIVAVGGIAFAMAWTFYSMVHLPRADRAEPVPAQSTPRLSELPDPGVPGPSPAERGTESERAASYFGHQLVLANAGAYFAYTYLLSVYLSWMPTFFVSRHHLNLQGAAFGSSVPWLMAFVGLWAGALLSDRIFRSTGRLVFSRTLVQVGGLLVAAAGTALVGEAPSALAAVVVASVALCSLYLAGTSFWAIVQDVVPSTHVGRISGFTHFIANLGGIAGPALTGLIVQRADSFRTAWFVAACISAAAALAVVFASRSRRLSETGARDAATAFNEGSR